MSEHLAEDKSESGFSGASCSSPIRDESLKNFQLGKPVLVCRWRLVNRQVLLLGRHLKALKMRQVPLKQATSQLINDPSSASVTKPAVDSESFTSESKLRPLSAALIGWCKQHLEWTLLEGAREFPDGVLMLVVDEDGQAAMSIGSYEPLQKCCLSDLLERAQISAREAEQSVIAPELLWGFREGKLICGCGVTVKLSGANGLILQLAHSLGIPLKFDRYLIDRLQQEPSTLDEAFLVSDEHGVVPAQDLACQESLRFVEAFEKLAAKARNSRP